MLSQIGRTLQTKYQINLPKINFKKSKPQIHLASHQNPLQFTHEQQMAEMTKLDEWANSLPTVKRKRNNTSQSIFYLYKSSGRYSSRNFQSLHNHQYLQTQISSAGLYMAQLQAEFAKIRKINYPAIYQNVQYCAGVYQIAFDEIFKKINSIKAVLQKNLDKKLKQIQQKRQLHRKYMNSTKKQKNKNFYTSRNKQNESSQINSQQLVVKKRKTYKQNIESQKQVSNFTNRLQSPRKSRNQNLPLKNLRLQKFISENRQNILANQSAIFKYKSQNTEENLQEMKQFIQKQEKKAKQLKKMLEKVEQVRVKTLNFSLQLGYDVREDGLIWILRQINNQNIQIYQNEKIGSENFKFPIFQQNLPAHKNENKEKYIPKYSQFPNFLNQQEINFILSKYKNNFKLQQIEKEKQEKVQEQKVIMQIAFQNVRRDRNRKLSMIKQKQLLQKLLQQKQTQRISGHKYLNQNTLKIMQQSQKIKFTKNQLIYQQTLRKLNKFCIQQIHGMGKGQYKNQSNNNVKVSKIMNEVKSIIEVGKNLDEKQQQIKNDQQRQLNLILKNLRTQIYQGRLNIKSQKRNPISVICCLVGWKKAKKILENQINASHPILLSHS